MLDARPGAGPVPEAIAARGWTAWLSRLDDARLDALEVLGHTVPWADDAPPSLASLAARARASCELPLLVHAAAAGPPRRRETPRKHAQVEAFARLVIPLARSARRVIDVGSGHGHLTRALAERVGAPVVGLERDPDIARRARALPSAARVDFEVRDVLADGLSLSPGDAVIGLHACGEIGDLMVVEAARSGAAVALVGCCLQKRRAPSRAALSAPEELAGALDLPRGVLGLSNLVARERGVEATRRENLAARERRLALHRLLAGGSPMRLGQEIDGLNRRAAHGDLRTLVRRAFERRGRPMPDERAIAAAETWARTHSASARRWSVPRVLLARALEVLALLDRAVFLERRGHAVAVGAVFPPDVSARNLALVASGAPR